MQANSNQPDRYLTERQAADVAQRSVHWFRRARWAGDGPPYIQTVKGGAVRYSERALIAWFEARTVSSTSQTKIS